MKDKLLVSNIMNRFPIHYYILKLKSFVLCHPKAYDNQFIGDGTEEKANIFKFYFPELGLCIEIKSYAANIFYGYTMSHNTAIYI